MLGNIYRQMQDAHALGAHLQQPIIPSARLAMQDMDEMQSIPIYFVVPPLGRMRMPMLSPEIHDRLEYAGRKGDNLGTISMDDVQTSDFDLGPGSWAYPVDEEGIYYG